MSKFSGLEKNGITFAEAQGVYNAGTLPSGISTLHIYTRDTTSGTFSFVKSCLGNVATFCDFTPASSNVTITTVASSAEMLQKVSDDPYGIGYCSLGEADPSRVTVLSLKRTTGSVIKYTRAVVDNGSWPMQRPLFAKVNVNPTVVNSNAVAFLNYVKSSEFKKSIIFKTSFFLPKTQEKYPTVNSW